MTDDRAAQTAPVLLHVEGGVATVTLNRPEAMNSLDLATKDLLVPTIRQVADDPAVRVVVITGSGRAFCVGQDLKEHIAGLMAGDEGLGVTVVKHYNPIAEMLATMNKPVIAALNGVAAGAGASIAMAADFRIMVEGGGMNLAFAGIALSCDTGSSFWLPRLVGVAKAKELMFTARRIGAVEAERLGLVNRQVPAGEGLQGALALAREILANGPVAVRMVKQAVNRGFGADLETGLAIERACYAQVIPTKDRLEGLAAFREKRQPRYRGE